MMNTSIIALLIIALNFSGCAPKTNVNEKVYSYPFEVITEEKALEAEIELETGEIIELELYPDVAPVTVSNFKYLCDNNFYDGLIFHRVIEGFMIQGGCPDGTGGGGPEHRIKGEFSSNGFENNLLHERGVISMARTNDPDSAGSQFFIMHEDAPHLDGEYAAFGRVTNGMEVVDKIATTKTGANNRPVEDVVIKTIRIK